MRNRIRQFLAAAAVGVTLAGAAGAWAASESDEAKRLKDAGAIVPLERIIERAQAQHPGRLLEAKLKQKRGRYVYEIEILDAQGVVWEMKFDAGSGELLKTEQER